LALKDHMVPSFAPNLTFDQEIWDHVAMAK